MKSKLLFVSLMTFFLATTLSFGQAQRMPRFWEFIANSPSVSGVSTAAQWMRNNFDEFNIPLISYRQAMYTPFSGVDSIFKHSAIVSQVRGFTWINTTLTNNVDMVSIYFPGYLYYLGGTQFSNGQPLFQTGAQAPGFFQTAKKAIDDVEAENGEFSCYTNVSVTSKFENGSIKGTVKMQCFDEYDASHCTIILAEGYHKYGTQDFYFIPRKMMNSDENMTGVYVSNLKQQKTVSFNFPIDKDWNPKYLYVIALAEVPNPFFGIPALFGAGVDRVVDVKTASSAVPVSLDISVNNPNDKFKRIDSDVNIVYKITNSGSKAVKALVYIDKNTSIVPDGWTATANKDTVTLQPGGNTTLQIKLSVIGTVGTAAVDVCVLPLETENNENPLITHAMAVASTNDQRIIAFVDGEAETNSVEANSYISPYKEQMTILPWQYYSAVPADAFEGYMFVKTTSVIRGTMTVMDGASPSSYFKIPGNFVANMSDNDKLAMSNYLVEPELQYINSVLQKGKHTALLIDRSCAYSAQADVNTKAEYTKLFNSFGVKYVGETELVYDNGFTGNKFELKSESGSAVATDPGTQQLIPNFMCHDYTYGGAGIYFRFSPYLTKFDITSPGKTTKAFTNGGAMVGAQALNGNQKLFILGTSPIGFPLVQPWPLGQIFSNLHQWWFGYIKKLNPEIYIAENTYDMDVVEVGSGVVMTKKIVIENRATNPEDTLKISSITWANNEDASFVVTEYPDNVILPGKKDTLTVQFDPKNPISYTNVTLEIKSNDQQVPVYRLLFSGIGKGTGQQGPHLEVDAGDMFHDFGSKEVNSSADLWDLVLYNGGTKQLNISSIKLSDATDKEVFELQGTNFNSIAKWDIKTISLRFLPTKVGFYEGAIVIKSDCYENPTLQIEFIADVTDSVGIVNDAVAMMFTATLNPNPTTEFVNINFNVLGELSRDVKINLVDASGKSIAGIDDAIYAPGSHSKQVNLKGIANGTYFIEYIVDGKRVISTLKILK